MNYSTMTEKETEIELGTSAADGISSFTAHDRLIDNGRNTPEKTYAPKTVSLIISQVKNLYTVAFFAMGAITLALDFKDGMAAWILFFAIALGNMALGLRRDWEDKIAAERFDERRTDPAKIVRDSKEVETDPTLIVKGDILVLKKGDFVPADARILECENFKVDESIFRRNTVPVSKKSDKMDYEGEITECFNMVYCGTSVIEGSAKAAVIQTGSETALAKMIDVKSKKLNMNDDFAKNTPTEKLLCMAALLSAIFMLIAVGFKTRNASAALLSSCTAALCLIPATVRAVRMAAMRKCSSDLTKKGVEFCERDFVYDIGSIDYLLFDKGKMLTDSDLKLEEKMSLDDTALKMAALCSDCTVTDTGAEGGDIDSAAVNAAYSAGIDVKKLMAENKKILFKPFDESRNLMASLHKTKNGYRLIVKGSIEVIPLLCTEIAGENGTEEMNGEAMHRLEELASSMAERGLKVRCVAYRNISSVPESIDDIINNMVFEGMFGYREVMTPKAGESIEKLESNFVKPVMVTGDNEITSFAVAKEASLAYSENDCISFRDLAESDDEALADAARKYKVFANASREDRVRLVSVLSRDGSVTAVAGDQMTAPSVKMCAGVSFGKDDEGDYDVSLKRSNFEIVSDVVARCRIMRSNMSSSSSLIVAMGVAEVLLMIFAAVTESIFPFKAIQMLLINLFITFFPTMALALFGHTNMRERGRRAGAISALHGFIGAIFAIASSSSYGFKGALCFFAFYAIFDAASMNFVKIRRKKDKNDFYLVLSLVISTILVIIAANNTVKGLFSAEGIVFSIVYAAIAALITLILAHVKIGRRG
jgi:Ca2+-transporting ATPase